MREHDRGSGDQPQRVEIVVPGSVHPLPLAGLHRHQARDAFAVPGRVAEGDLAGLGSLEIELQVMHRGPTHFLHQHGHGDQPQPAAARFLRVENAEPTLLGEPSPEDFGHHRRFRHPLTHKDKDSEAFAFEELSGAEALLCGAPVTAAVEAHHVAEMRPQSQGPGSVRRLAPFGRVRNFGRRKMVERHITLGGAGAA